MPIQQMGFENWIFVIVLLIGGLITLLTALSNFLRDKKRREIMTVFAEQIGLTYLPQGDNSLMRRMSGFKLFSLGRAKKIKNLIFGDTGDELMSIFDYQYSVGSGKNQTIHRQSVVAIESANLIIPTFNLRSGSVFHRLGNVIGMNDIIFEMHPGFSRNQVLLGADEEAIKNFFDDRMLNYFENNNFCIEAVEGKLIYYIPKKSYRLEEMKHFIETAFEVYSRLAERAVAVSQ